MAHQTAPGADMAWGCDKENREKASEKLPFWRMKAAREGRPRKNRSRRESK